MSSLPAWTREDAEWAHNFVTLYKFLKSHPNSENATLLLSTCRNAYLTVNALFADVQELLGGAALSPLRGACELIAQESPEIPKIRKRFQAALVTVAQFDQKQAVWRDRHALKKSLDDQLLTFQDQHPLDAVLVQDILSGQGAALADQADGRSAELLKINLAEERHLDRYFEALRRLRDIFDAAARLGISFTDQVAVAQMTLIDDTDGQTPPADKTVAHWASRIAGLCGWTAADVAAGLEVRIEPTYKRPSNAHAIKPLLVTGPAGVTAAAVAALLREALYFAHHMASATFDPNVAALPMPGVFNVALPVPRPTMSSSEIQAASLKRVLCSGAHRPPGEGQVALAHFAVPATKLNGKDFAFVDKQLLSEQIEADFNKAVHAAAKQGCLALAFPEYSIPEGMRGRLLEIANRNNLVLIGGFEGQWDANKLRDEVFVAIPGEPSLYQQFKQSPSLDEPQPESFYRDGELKLFCNSPIGDFAVVVCSDFYELATLNAWALDGPLPDVIFVIARNRYDKLYESIAIADSYRLYCCVAVCNVHDDDAGQATAKGTFVAKPLKSDPVQYGRVVKVEGTFLTGISVHGLPFAQIRARERGKPTSLFFAMPRSAKRH